jgi:CubicO group peptidase (beta-lactamase class C family)
MTEKSGITAANWNQPENVAMSFQQVQRLFPSLRLEHNPEARLCLGLDEQNVLGIKVPWDGDQAQTVGELLAATHTDAFLVLKGGTIVAEHYFNGMTADRHHLLNSVTKSFVGVLAGVAAGRGLLDPDALLTEYLPEFSQSAWAGANVRQLLDMTAGAHYTEDYADSTADFWREASVVGWCAPPANSARGPGLFEFARSLQETDQPHGEKFYYRTVCTNVLGMVIERAMHKPLAEILGEELWTKLHTGHDASLVVDPHGFPYVGAGLSACARDVARFGMMLLNDGQYAGEQIVPAAWIRDTVQGDGDSKACFSDSKYGELMPGWHYRNQFWVPALGRDVLLGVGIHGQALFVDKTTQTVIVKFSSQPTMEIFEMHMAGIAAMDAVATGLAER